jgi:hypothetical protein
MKASMNALLLTAALTGMVGGAAAVSAQPVSGGASHSQVTKTSNAGVMLTAMGQDKDKDKHSCKGKNDCKGKGGCKTGDNGCKGKNSCKGKGGCATDGSKAPKNV